MCIRTCRVKFNELFEASYLMFDEKYRLSGIFDQLDTTFEKRRRNGQQLDR